MTILYKTNLKHKKVQVKISNVKYISKISNKKGKQKFSEHDNTLQDKLKHKKVQGKIGNIKYISTISNRIHKQKLSEHDNTLQHKTYII